ncbi:MAG: ribosomal protein S18-alanine N-acetyltransferase [Gammaproteobacteria bacterium]|nr:ribosomal protein S18-alanine N-acetyltransferase [Gammaproteobacteria bacterium]
MSLIKPPNCRSMCIDDLPAVLAIEEEYNPSPWKKQHFETSLSRHLCWVLEEKHFILGYAILSVFQTEGEILNIAIHPQYRRQGLGEFLLTRVLKEAKQKAVQTLFLEVRKSNLAAQTLYHKMGFHQVGVRAAYYPSGLGRREDGFIFAREDLR